MRNTTTAITTTGSFVRLHRNSSSNKFTANTLVLSPFQHSRSLDIASIQQLIH